jgi:hypothetical protein
LAITESGGSLAPLLPALALVALAGAGALLATRSWLRQVVGALVGLAGIGFGFEAVRVAASVHDVTVGWAALCVVGAVLVVASGLLALRRGRAWPAMGAGMWDAIDRGHDPTAAGEPADSPATDRARVAGTEPSRVGRPGPHGPPTPLEPHQEQP